MTFDEMMAQLLAKGTRKTQDVAIGAFQNLPEPVKLPLRQAVGRVATNVIDPYAYSSTMYKGDVPTTTSKLEATLQAFRPSRLGDTISSIVKDQPVYNTPNLPNVQQQLNARRPLFREFFDLPPQDVDQVYSRVGKQYSINPETKNLVAQDTINEFQHPSGSPAYNFISGNYTPGKPDPWDFNLHPSEVPPANRPMTSEEFGRSLLTALGRPAVLRTGGYYNPPPKERLDDIIAKSVQ